jgi:hypothetical protein
MLQGFEHTGKKPQSHNTTTNIILSFPDCSILSPYDQNVQLYQR